MSIGLFAEYTESIAYLLALHAGARSENHKVTRMWLPILTSLVSEVPLTTPEPDPVLPQAALPSKRTVQGLRYGIKKIQTFHPLRPGMSTL
jgi:hypothetical protein